MDEIERQMRNDDAAIRAQAHHGPAPLDQLATALAKAQAQIEHATKDSVNPHFGSKYATLADVWDACRKALTDHGLSVVQMPRCTDAGGKPWVHVETLLLHSSGQSISSSLSMPVDRATAQGVGSAITYARRYSLAAMVGVTPDDDDDGNTASGGGRGQRQQRGGQRSSNAKLDNLGAAVKLRYQQLGGKGWKAWSDVLKEAGADGSMTLESMAAIHRFLKAELAKHADPEGKDDGAPATQAAIDAG